jgi:hypothetical protein
MTRTEMLARIGRHRLAIEPVRSEIDGVWRIQFTAEESNRALLMDVGGAAELASELRLGGERLLATRIEISIEQARRRTVSGKAWTAPEVGLPDRYFTVD